jgi:hypothetical protein
MTDTTHHESIGDGVEQLEADKNSLAVAMQEVQLINYDAARRALAEAVRVDDVKTIHDQAMALKACAKIAKDKQMELDAAELRLRAERRLGEIMAEKATKVGKAKPPSGKGQRKTDRRVATQPDGPATLAEAGIDKNLAHRARSSAKLCEKIFDQRVAEMRRGDRGQLDIRRAAKRGRSSGKPAKITIVHDKEDDGGDGPKHAEAADASPRFFIIDMAGEVYPLDSMPENLHAWLRGRP